MERSGITETSITRCMNKDSLGRQCNQMTLVGSEFCGINKGDETCASLATQYLKYPYEEGISNETKVWLSRHNPELLRKLQSEKKVP